MGEVQDPARTIVRLRHLRRRWMVVGMDPHLLLAKLLSIAALMASTIEYAEVLRRRVATRAAAREQALLERCGLHGLVRVFLADDG